MAGRSSAVGSGGATPCNTVFIDTSLDTHLAMIVSDKETVSELKEKIIYEHPLCFPNIGVVKIHAIKVKRRGHYYHLSDSMSVKSAFHGIRGSWFLSVDASSPSQPQLPSNPDACNPVARTGMINDTSADRVGNVLNCLPKSGKMAKNDAELGAKLLCEKSQKLLTLNANNRSEHELLESTLNDQLGKVMGTDTESRSSSHTNGRLISRQAAEELKNKQDSLEVSLKEGRTLISSSKEALEQNLTVARPSSGKNKKRKNDTQLEDNPIEKTNQYGVKRKKRKTSSNPNDRIYAIQSTATAETMQKNADNGRGERLNPEKNIPSVMQTDSCLYIEMNEEISCPPGNQSSKRKVGGPTRLSSAALNLTMDKILRSSSRYKKAKITASQSQLEEAESQQVEFVPDSLPDL